MHSTLDLRDRCWFVLCIEPHSNSGQIMFAQSHSVNNSSVDNRPTERNGMAAAFVLEGDILVYTSLGTTALCDI